MKRKQVLVVGNVSYKVMSSLKCLSKHYDAKKIIISGIDITKQEQQGKPDVIVVFVKNVNSGNICDMKKVFDKLNYTSVSIICIGDNSECNLFFSIFNNYDIKILLHPFLLEKLNEVIMQKINREEISEIKEESVKKLKNILVVDDDTKILRLISAYLDDIYKVSVVNSGASAIAYLGKKKPDAILLDYIMPVCDGKQVLEMIRDLRGMEEVPVVFLTGVSDKERVKECLKLNLQGYLLKPVAKDKLLKRLNSIFNEEK